MSSLFAYMQFRSNILTLAVTLRENIVNFVSFDNKLSPHPVSLESFIAYGGDVYPAVGRKWIETMFNVFIS